MGLACVGNINSQSLCIRAERPAASQWTVVLGLPEDRQQIFIEAELAKASFGVTAAKHLLGDELKVAGRRVCRAGPVGSGGTMSQCAARTVAWVRISDLGFLPRPGSGKRQLFV
jgi:hypothetical protein